MTAPTRFALTPTSRAVRTRVPGRWPAGPARWRPAQRDRRAACPLGFFPADAISLRQRFRRGPADDKLRREIEDLYRAVAPVDPLEQQLSRLGAQLVVRKAHRGERRPEPVDERHVVEADHGNVVGALQGAFVERGVTPT